MHACDCVTEMSVLGSLDDYTLLSGYGYHGCLGFTILSISSSGNIHVTLAKLLILSYFIIPFSNLPMVLVDVARIKYGCFLLYMSSHSELSCPTSWKGLIFIKLWKNQ